MKLTRGQARVLLFLLENANDDGECYRFVKEIAKAVELSQIYVRQVTRQLAKLGMIAYEWMWELDGRETELSPKLIPAKMALIYRSGDDYYYPGGNLYKILQPDLGGALLQAAHEGHYVNSDEPAIYQLELPFPPSEKTILAPGARFYDRKIEPVGVCR